MKSEIFGVKNLNILRDASLSKQANPARTQAPSYPISLISQKN